VCLSRRLHIPDDCLAKPLVCDLAFLREGEDDREGKAILARDQAAQLLAESRRQHWHSTLHEVDTGRTLLGVPIKSGVWLDEVRDIRDVDANIVGAIFVVLDGEGVVKVLGSLRVNSKYALLP
jgi:hypothetical protein